MTEKIFYLVGNTHDGKFYDRFNSYDDAMEYIKREYAYEKEREDDDSTFIDGYYGIYRISEDDAERIKSEMGVEQMNEPTFSEGF